MSVIQQRASNKLYFPARGNQGSKINLILIHERHTKVPSVSQIFIPVFGSCLSTLLLDPAFRLVMAFSQSKPSEFHSTLIL